MKQLECDRFINLITRQTVELLSVQEEELLNSHLAVCESCTRFRNTLIHISTSLNIEQEPELLPDPKIQSLLRNKIVNQYKKPEPVIQEVVKKLKLILQYRIPVYQVGLAVIILAVLFTIPAQRPDTISGRSSWKSEKNIVSPFTSPYLRNTIPAMENRNVGINAGEDSLLTVFSFTSM